MKMNTDEHIPGCFRGHSRCRVAGCNNQGCLTFWFDVGCDLQEEICLCVKCVQRGGPLKLKSLSELGRHEDAAMFPHLSCMELPNLSQIEFPTRK
jgi:hypothetical protein